MASGIRVDNYMIAMAAAENEAVVVLGWKGVVALLTPAAFPRLNCVILVRIDASAETLKSANFRGAARPDAVKRIMVANMILVIELEGTN